MNVPDPCRRRGFLLLEMILALAVFSMAATGFVVALQRMSKTATHAHNELRVTRILDSALNETLSLPVLEPGEMDYPVEGSDIEIRVVIEPIEEMENEDGMMLQEMFRIRIRGRWYQSGVWHERNVETWRYGRMYQP